MENAGKSRSQFITTAIILALAFSCGVLTLFAIRAVAAIEQTRRVLGEELARESKANSQERLLLTDEIRRQGVIADAHGTALLLRVQSPYGLSRTEDYVVHIAPDTRIKRRDPKIQDGIIVGLGETADADKEELKPGMRVYIIMRPGDSGITAQLILLGDPFPIP